MKKIDLQNKDRNALLGLLDELRSKLFQLRFDLADKKLKDVSQISKARRDIARVLTALKTQR